MRIVIYPNNEVSLDGVNQHWGDEDFRRAGIPLERVLQSEIGKGGGAWKKICEGGCEWVIFPTEEVGGKARHGARAYKEIIDGIAHYMCSYCGEIKSVDCFWRRTGGRDGYDGRCIPCRKKIRNKTPKPKPISGA